jgi:hypothetical protein
MRNLLAFVALSLVLIVDVSGQAEWQTIIHTLLGGRPTPADPHPLRYWTLNPILRHRGNSLCMGCPRRGGGVITEKDYTAESKVTDLGTMAGYRILQVNNRVVAKDAPADTPISKNPPEYRRHIDYKILLVQTGADEYREIYHLENDWNAFQPLTPARIIQTDFEAVLVTMDSDGGNGGGCLSAFWWFDKSGPHSLNFDATDVAIKNNIPPNSYPFARCQAINFDTQEINAWVLSDPGCRTCILGTAKVRFVVRGSRVEPTGVEFIPDRPQ